MKTSKFLSFALLFAATGLVMNSCSVSDNEKVAEQAEDLLAKSTAYYITGKVYDQNDKGLQGVEVSTGSVSAESGQDGTFTLTVNEKGTHTISVAKEGYISAPTTVTIAESAKNHSSVFATMSMFEVSNSYTAKVNATTIITESGVVSTTGASEVASIEIPAGALAQDIKVAITPYVPSPNSTTGTNSKNTAIGGIYVQAEDNNMTVNQPVTIRLNNNGTGTAMFDEVSVYRYNASRGESDYVKIGTATSDATGKVYSFTIEAGSQLTGAYAFSITAQNTQSNNVTTTLAEKTIDNSGNFAAMNDVEINYTTNVGWEYLITPKEALKNIPDGSKLEEMLDNAVETLEGTQGTFSVTTTQNTNVSGNSILYYNIKGNSRETSYTFNIKVTNNRAVTPVTVKVKKYTGVNFNYSIQSADQHSGGTSGAN